ncbi:MAG: hypothetical protein ACREN5_05395, partial [Gemmatimonadales bacterium]
VHLFLIHTSNDIPSIDRPPYSFRVRRILLLHKPAVLRVASRKNRGKDEQAVEKDHSCRHYKLSPSFGSVSARMASR